MSVDLTQVALARDAVHALHLDVDHAAGQARQQELSFQAKAIVGLVVGNLRVRLANLLVALEHVPGNLVVVRLIDQPNPLNLVVPFSLEVSS